MLLRYHFSSSPSSKHHECEKSTKRYTTEQKKGDEHEKRRTIALCYFLAMFMIPHPCLDTLSPLPSFLRYPFHISLSISRQRQCANAIAGTACWDRVPFLFCFVNRTKKRRRQCFYAIANAGSRGRFWLSVYIYETRIPPNGDDELGLAFGLCVYLCR